MHFIERPNLQNIIALAKERGYGIRHNKDTLTGVSSQVIIIGEVHHSPAQQIFQEELICTIKPAVVLHDLYDGSGESAAKAKEVLNGWKKQFNVQMRSLASPTKLQENIADSLWTIAKETIPGSRPALLEESLCDPISEWYAGQVIRRAYREAMPVLAVVSSRKIRPESRLYTELGPRPSEDDPLPIGFVVINCDNDLTRSLNDQTQFFSYSEKA